MRVLTDKLFKTLFAGIAAASLVACGGGGGGGDATAPGVSEASDPIVSINAYADRTALPLNLEGFGHQCDSSGGLASTPYNAMGSQYMTTIYVQAKTAAGKTLSGSGLFSYTIVSGFDSGELYYLDGAHETGTITCSYMDDSGATQTKDNTTAGAYHYGSLDAAANGSTMHLLATDKVGTIVIKFAVTDTQTNKEYSKLVSVAVGGTATSLPSQALVDSVSSTYMYPQGYNSPNQVVAQVGLYDEAGQYVADPAVGVNNARLRIVSTTSDGTATLRGVDTFGNAVSGADIAVASNNGKAQFTIVSGTAAGYITVEVMADRTDNNVDNGISSLVYQYVSIPVVTSVGGSAPTITTKTVPDGTVGQTYQVVLEASGGTPGYIWSVSPSTPLPAGLSVSNGVISGTPSAAVSNYQVKAVVTDANGKTAEQVLTFAIAAASAS